MQTVWIPVVMPGWNQINGGGVGQKIRTKKKAMEDVCLFLQRAHLNKIWGPAFFLYDWRAPDRRRDPSNIAAGGRKIVEDALQKVKVLPNDGWTNVLGWMDRLSVDRHCPGLILGIMTQAELGVFDLKGFCESGLPVTPF